MILIATPSSDTLTQWQRGTSDFEHVGCAQDLPSLKLHMELVRPEIILLDYDLLGENAAIEIARLLKLCQSSKIVILSPELPEQTEWEMFKAGARGFCKKDVDHALLKRVVIAVRQGELWIRRSFTSRLLAELEAMEHEKRMMRQSIGDLLANLTERENEIVTLVGNGETNKQIAMRLEISERTVKAHLTEIFRKLNVADRLNLALLVSGTVASKLR